MSDRRTRSGPNTTVCSTILHFPQDTRSIRPSGSVSSTWFNFETDTVYLDHETFSVNRRTLGRYIERGSICALTDELEGGHRMLNLENLRRVR